MATVVTATATNAPVHIVHRISPWVNIAGECSKKNRKRASNTENLRRFYMGRPAGEPASRGQRDGGHGRRSTIG